MKKLFILLPVIFSCYLTYSQDTINIPTDYQTIQEGINAANNGDVVLVDENTYFENITFSGKAITLASRFLTDGDETHISNTVIDGSQPIDPDYGTVVAFITGEDTTSVLYGFTITGGTGTYVSEFDDVSGGGIYIYGAGAKICNNIIEQNAVDYEYAYGGGLIIDTDQDVILKNNIIRNNEVTATEEGAGGGISLFGASTISIINNTISDNTVSGSSTYGCGVDVYGQPNIIMIIGNQVEGNQSNSNNGHGGGISLYNCSSAIENNLIFSNSSTVGGGINFEYDLKGTKKFKRNNRRNSSYSKTFDSNSDVPFILKNNTIVNNMANNSGGGIEVYETSIQVINSIIRGNTAPANPQISGTADIQYSDIEGGYTGNGNIDVDPDFRDILNKDFHLSATECGEDSDSPCIDAGDPTLEDLLLDCEWGLGQQRSDMGAYGGANVIVGVREDKPLEDIRIYPNPAMDKFSLQSAPDSYRGFSRQSADLAIYDLNGRKLIEKFLPKGKETVQIDVSGLENGMYLVQFQFENQTITKKLIIKKY